MTEEERKKVFDDYMKGEEFTVINEFIKIKKDLVPLETSLEDVNDDRKAYLELLFKIVAVMKVPGRKAKSYEQKYFRTIFFTKNQEKTIDGTTFTVTNDTKVHIWNSKQAIANIEIHLDPEMFETTLTPESLNTWRKDLIKLLKDFDKLYVQHIKPSTKSKQYSHDEMAGYHKTAMTPLVELMDSNWNFKKHEIMMEKDKSLPVFRFNALEERFVVDFTNFNNVIKQYGNLKDYYDIR